MDDHRTVVAADRASVDSLQRVRARSGEAGLLHVVAAAAEFLLAPAAAFAVADLCRLRSRGFVAVVVRRGRRVRVATAAVARLLETQVQFLVEVIAGA